MVFSYYLLKYPYKIAWNLNKLLSNNHESVMYCADYLDFIIFREVQKHLKEIPIVASSTKIKHDLSLYDISSETYPALPKAVFMCRHACYKFPEENILKFGFRHGAYHFKKLTNPNNYNAFTAFFVTSKKEVEIAREAGITTCQAIGYPKLDPAFNGTYNQEYLQDLFIKLGLDSNRQTIMFTATWDKSGMSAINQWIDNLDNLYQKYNILVTVHPWTSQKYKNILRYNQKIKFIEHPDIVAYLMLADLVIGDTSSILAEACALDKPIITFKVNKSNRTLNEIEQLITNISWQIDNIAILEETLSYGLLHKDEKVQQRQEANLLMFDVLDGQAGKRAGEIITSYLPELKL